MVVEFLKKINTQYEEDANRYRDELGTLETELIENEKFIKLLESETEKVFRDFTPREIDNKDRRKIKELHAKQDELTRSLPRRKIRRRKSVRQFKRFASWKWLLKIPGGMRKMYIMQAARMKNPLRKN